MGHTSGEVSQLLQSLRLGDRDAEARLFDAIYLELRRIAGRYMRQERPDHTLQATALVHEAYVRLIDQREKEWHNRAHFLGVAAQAMRRILIDHARTRLATKRGGGQRKVSLEESPALFIEVSDDLVALDEALTRLAQVDQRQSRIVELRFFGGLTEQETAEVLGVSDRTVKRDWVVAKAWLYRELKTMSS